jgi:hypothetical protein
MIWSRYVDLSETTFDGGRRQLISGEFTASHSELGADAPGIRYFVSGTGLLRSQALDAKRAGIGDQVKYFNMVNDPIPRCHPRENWDLRRFPLSATSKTSLDGVEDPVKREGPTGRGNDNDSFQKIHAIDGLEKELRSKK